MIFLQNLAEVDRYFSEVRKELTFMKPKCQISDIALRWLGFCLTGMIIVGALCWQKFERVSGGTWLGAPGRFSWLRGSNELIFSSAS